MKKFTALLITAILIVSMLGVMTAFAGTSISGNSEVVKGKTYTYTIKVSASGIFMMGHVKCSGIFTGASVEFGAGSGSSKNVSLSDTVKIKVTVSSSAKPGDTGKIYISNASYSYYDSSGNVKDKDLSGSKTVKVVSASAATPAPSKKTSATLTKPKATPKPTEWDIAEQKVALLNDEGSLSVDIAKDPKIPSHVLTTLKEKKGSLTLNMGSYSCTIDGKTLQTLPKDSDSIDLSVKMEKDESLSAAAGGRDVYQLHFAHSGQLPGRFTYSFKAQDSAPGDTLYLYYYYDKSGVVEGMQTAVVDENGYVSFDIYHCSSYFVTKAAIEDAAGADFTSQHKHAAQLLELENANNELKAQLEIAGAQLSDTKAELEELRQEENPATHDPSILGASVGVPAEKLFGVPYGALIAAMLGVALLTVLLTMAFCRAGVFKKKERPREDML